MPAYDFKCPRCGYVEEVTCSMEAITSFTVFCMECQKPEDAEPGVEMRRVYGNSGVVFKGSFPGQDIKRKQEDSNLQRQRRKAWLLKDRGDVPMEHVIHPKEADERFDKKYPASKVNEMYTAAAPPLPPPRRRR